MKFIILGLLSCLSVVLAFPQQNEELNDEWDAFKIKFEKRYEPLVESTRRLIWEENLKYIQQHNLEYDLGKHSYYLGVNQFSDMTNDEFKALYLAFRPPQDNTSSSVFLSPENIGPLPSSVDWRQKDCVTPVKDQGQCHSRWLFSVTGVLEGQYCRKSGHLVNFSEQQLIDCSQSFGNNVCNGVYMNFGYRYVAEFGIESETSYPYEGTVGSCRYNKSKVVTYIHGSVYIAPGNEVILAEAVATVGPIAVAIDASHPSFQSYKGGIYNEMKCSTTALDLDLLLVGYGKQNGQNYWLVKNSWGTTWGIEGYILMSKDKGNQCGIASMASYPLL